MNVQAMMFEFSQVSNLQNTKLEKTSSNKEDFSQTLEKSQKNQNQAKDKEIPKKVKETDSKEVKQEDCIKDSKEKVSSKEVNEPEEVKLEEGKGKDKLAKVMEDIANILGITMEELENILENMQIGLADLLEGNNLQELIMEVHQVEDPIDLLSIPEVSSKISQLKSTLENMPLISLIEKSEEIFEESLQVITDELVDEAKIDKPGKEAKGQQVEALDISDEDKPDNKPEALNEKVEPDKMLDESVQTKESEATFEGNQEFASGQDELANEFVNNLSQAVEEAFQVTTETSQVRYSQEAAVDPKLVLDQIVEKIKVAAVDENPMMNIQLKPEHLGKLTMEVISKQGLMTAQFTVESDKTKEVLEQNIQQLRETLEAKGLVIDELEVTVGQNQGENTQDFNGPTLKRNISDIISSIMNEDLEGEEVESTSHLDSTDSEVDYIA